MPANDSAPSRGWALAYDEDFSSKLAVDNAPWVRDPLGEDSPWYVDSFSDDGRFYEIQGGEDFARLLDSFDTLRKGVAFGQDGWLTAEMAARDYTGDGVPESPPSLSNIILDDGTAAAYLDEPSHDGGLIIRSTKPLPPQYRIEYRLKGLNFGGQRDGEWNYDGLINGYGPDGCKTSFPWKARGDFSGPADPCNENFSDVRDANGYYFLSIMDYPRPAPRNNIFIHTHRKVGMDLYTVSGNEGGGYSVCNPATGALYRQNSTESTGNAINAIFFNGAEFQDPRIAYNQFMMETECGTFYGTGAGTGIVSAAEIRPEVMPGADYLFAIERTATGYTMEMSGEFLYVGEATLRYSRNFVQDGKPIWHYNNSPEQYDGAFDQSLTFTGPFGEYTLDHTWPAGSAYPDYFIIGDPHTNYYEGNATIADIRLYVPGEVKGFYAPVDMGGVWNTVKGGSTVPLKFEVFSGSTELTSTSAVKSFTVKGVACPGALAATHDIELVTTGGTSLRYDSTAGHGQFIQNWQTPKKPGACYAVTMTTQAGSSVSANFWLK